MKRGLKVPITSPSIVPDTVATYAPMKRGLKDKSTTCHKNTYNVATYAPMKRGLKVPVRLGV